jgi:hypothetical protein
MMSMVYTQAEISANEEARKEVQARIDRLTAGNQNVAFLNLISTFRMQVWASTMVKAVAVAVAVALAAA